MSEQTKYITNGFRFFRASLTRRKFSFSWLLVWKTREEDLVNNDRSKPGSLFI